jgi:hypothetical protein
MVLAEDTFTEAPEELDCPFEVEHIWDWFLHLNRRRQNGMSINPISHQEITAWSEGMKKAITPFERDALTQLDDAYIEHQNSKEKK